MTFLQFTNTLALIYYLLSTKYVTNSALGIKDTWTKHTICVFKERTSWGRETTIRTE